MRKFWTSILLLQVVLATAQITDDSSELVYSSKTTQIIYESHLKNNKQKEIHPDTTLYELEKFGLLEQLDFKYQNLGNNGTAMYPIFYPVTQKIGLTSGFKSYDLYMNKLNDTKYYDTKSPFMNVMVAFGGQGRSLVDFSFSRNVNKNWNVGFDIYRITSDKQIGNTGQGDRNVQGNIFNIYTYYKHPEIPYKVMLHYTNLNFDIEETGGIYIEDLETAISVDFFEFQDADIQLRDARAAEQRDNIHLYHQYAWKKPLEFYHTLDISTQDVSYRDFIDGTIENYNPYRNYYDRFLLDADSTYQKYDWSELVNEAGIKGNLANLFYRAYLKRRDIRYESLYGDEERVGELYLGGYTRFDWRDKFDIEASGELLQTGEYRINAQLNSDLLFGSYQSVRYKPSAIHKEYFGNHHEWDQSFASGFYNEITAGLQARLDWLRVRPLGRIVTLDQFIFFDEDRMARQSGDIAILTSIGGDIDFKVFTSRKFKKAFHFENEVLLTGISGAGADNLRVPAFFFNGRYFWRGKWFKNTMEVEIGGDVHAKTSYDALGYAPEIQQFYLQDEFTIDSYLTVDAFINMKVNNLRVFVRVNNINQPADGGYFVSPFYPGPPRMLDFGARWMFFD